MKQNNLKQAWDGAHYNNNSTLQFNTGKKLLELINFKGNESVLDIGCGSGALAAFIAENCVPNGSVAAIDSDSSMIAMAKTVYKDIHNLSIENKSALDLETNLNQEKFDIILSVFCLHWIMDKESMRKSIQGVESNLKPGGKFLAIISLQDSPAHPIIETRIAKEIINSARWKTYYENANVLGNDLTLYDYQEIITSSNLTGSAVLYQSPIITMSKDHFKGALLAIPLTHYVPAELKEAFLEDLIDASIANNLQNEDGTYRVSMMSGMINAYKPL